MSSENRKLSHFSPNELNASVMSHAASYGSSRQLARRFLELLPNKLKTVQSKYRKKHSCAKSERLALLDDEYVSHIDQIVHWQNEALLSRMQWETCLLMVEIRKQRF